LIVKSFADSIKDNLLMEHKLQNLFPAPLSWRENAETFLQSDFWRDFKGSFAWEPLRSAPFGMSAGKNRCWRCTGHLRQDGA
jgi:hypothetical protein